MPTFTTRRFPGGYSQGTRWQTNRAGDRDLFIVCRLDEISANWIRERGKKD